MAMARLVSSARSTGRMKIFCWGQWWVATGWVLCAPHRRVCFVIVRTALGSISRTRHAPPKTLDHPMSNVLLWELFPRKRNARHAPSSTGHGSHPLQLTGHLRMTYDPTVLPLSTSPPVPTEMFASFLFLFKSSMEHRAASCPNFL